ncbi:hypothetical protein FRAHR75_1310014 [Frankia sp. Hr75.2]|nr:hypothetical protein FRAHR75_1310014 [Frankia sp. Hr75.2]
MCAAAPGRRRRPTRVCLRRRGRPGSGPTSTPGPVPARAAGPVPDGLGRGGPSRLVSEGQGGEGGAGDAVGAHPVYGTGGVADRARSRLRHPYLLPRVDSGFLGSTRAGHPGAGGRDGGQGGHRGRRGLLERGVHAGGRLVLRGGQGVVPGPMKELLVLLEDQLHARGINLHILTGICAGLHRPAGATIADKMLLGRVSGCDQRGGRVNSLIQIIEARR